MARWETYIYCCLVQRNPNFLYQHGELKFDDILVFYSGRRSKCFWTSTDGAYSIITMWNRNLERFGNTVEFPIRDTHYPNEIINILDMFLVRFSAKTMLLPQGPPHFCIHTFLSKTYTCAIIILDSYSSYCGLFQKTDIASPVSMDNLHPRIVHFVPSLQKKTQYFFTIMIKCSFYSRCNSTIKFDVLIKFLAMFLIIECY